MNTTYNTDTRADLGGVLRGLRCTEHQGRGLLDLLVLARISHKHRCEACESEANSWASHWSPTEAYLRYVEGGWREKAAKMRSYRAPQQVGCEKCGLGAGAGSRPDPCRFAPPLEALKLVEVPEYGTVVLRNTSARGLLIVPMHIGFFQAGAQNHATSRALVLDAGELLRAEDCYCIQESQGGLLKQAHQRFLMLPLGLRPAALRRRAEGDFGSMWEDIDAFNRFFGITRGGHYERFLRPYFGRLQALRHAFEPLPGQLGAAYFVGGRLAGVELAPGADYFAQVAPIFAIYCYGPAELQGLRRRWMLRRPALELRGLTDLDQLEQRLQSSRQEQREALQRELRELAELPFEQQVEQDRHGLRVETLRHGEWAGQRVRDEQHTLYLSLFRDVAATHKPVSQQEAS